MDGGVVGERWRCDDGTEGTCAAARRNVVSVTREACCCQSVRWSLCRPSPLFSSDSHSDCSVSFFGPRRDGQQVSVRLTTSSLIAVGAEPCIAVEPGRKPGVVRAVRSCYWSSGCTPAAAAAGRPLVPAPGSSAACTQTVGQSRLSDTRSPGHEQVRSSAVPDRESASHLLHNRRLRSGRKRQRPHCPVQTQLHDRRHIDIQITVSQS